MKYITKARLCLLIIVLAGYMSMSYRGGPTAVGGDVTGSPLSGGYICSKCHSPGGYYTPAVMLQLLNSSGTPVTSYTAGTAYTVRITITTSTGSSPSYGFQLVALQTSTNNGINTWGTLPAQVKSTTYNGREYLEHSFLMASNIINIPWTSPATNTGDISFYCAANIVNGNFHESGDNSANTSLTISPVGIGSCVPPLLSTMVTDVKCKGDSTGAVSLTVTGNGAPYNFSWHGAGGYHAASQNVTATPAGSYDLVVTATGGCSVKTNVVIKEPATKMSCSISSNSPVCQGDSLGMSGTATGGAGTLTFSWKDSKNSIHSKQQLYINPATLSDSGSYIFTVSDTLNCVIADSFHAEVNALPYADSIIAGIQGNNVVNFDIAHPLFIQSPSWDYGDGNTGNILKPTHQYGMAGIYLVRLVISNNCGADTLYKTINVGIPAGLERVAAASIEVFPNPAKDVIHIKTDRLINGDIYVLDAAGSMVLKSSFDSLAYRLDISLLSNGLYTIKIAGKNRGLFYRRIAIAK